MDIAHIHAPLRAKLCSLSQLLAMRADWKEQQLRVGFTNGVFDILHLGHVDYLSKAAAQVDALVIGLNADSSVRRLGKGRGEERPIHPEAARAAVLGGLECVSAIVIFEEVTPLNLIQAIQPDVLFKGADYDAEQSDTAHPRYIVGSTEVRSLGGQVQTIELVEGFSTTNIIEKLR